MTPPIYRIVKPQDDKLRVLVYGQSGTGKTLLSASTADHPDLGAVLVFDIDKGLSSISWRSDIIAVSITKPEEMEQVLKDLLLPPAARPSSLKDVRTLVIDSLSALKETITDSYTGQEFKRGKRVDAYSPEWKDWGRMTRFIAASLDSLRQQDKYHIVMTAGEKLQFEGERLSAITPDLTPTLASRMHHLASSIWRTDKYSKYFRLQVISDEGVSLVKTRNPVFVEALGKLTVDHARSIGIAKPEAAHGYYIIPSYDHPTLSNIYTCYVDALSKSMEEHNA